MSRVAFELVEGSLTIDLNGFGDEMDETEGAPLSLSFSFEAYNSGKCFETQFNATTLADCHSLFAFDPLIASELVTERPTRILIEMKANEQHAVHLFYEAKVMRRKHTVEFLLPSKVYPEGMYRKSELILFWTILLCSFLGSNSEVIELKRQLRLANRVITDLQTRVVTNLQAQVPSR